MRSLRPLSVAGEAGMKRFYETANITAGFGALSKRIGAG